mmetsp:Transcript_709/g.2354  ORF Transcript_709/g.2354 Transcript_709/m.2354 type:complete len:147 (+) Transcript_709:235-675(+)
MYRSAAETVFCTTLTLLVSAISFSYLYATLLFNDLDADAINTVELCERLNWLTAGQFALQAVLLATFLSRRHVALALVSTIGLASHIDWQRFKLFHYDSTTIVTDQLKERQLYTARLVLSLAILFFTLHDLLQTFVASSGHFGRVL